MDETHPKNFAILFYEFMPKTTLSELVVFYTKYDKIVSVLVYINNLLL